VSSLLLAEAIYSSINNY